MNNSTAMYEFLKTLHPGGIRTHDILVLRRTRDLVYWYLVWSFGNFFGTILHEEKSGNPTIWSPCRQETRLDEKKMSFSGSTFWRFGDVLTSRAFLGRVTGFGRVFEFWAIVDFGHIFENYWLSPTFCSTLFLSKSYVLILTKHGLGFKFHQRIWSSWFWERYL
jgi:hypothetical protein